MAAIWTRAGKDCWSLFVTHTKRPISGETSTLYPPLTMLSSAIFIPSRIQNVSHQEMYSREFRVFSLSARATTRMDAISRPLSHRKAARLWLLNSKAAKFRFLYLINFADEANCLGAWLRFRPAFPQPRASFSR